MSVRVGECPGPGRVCGGDPGSGREGGGVLGRAGHSGEGFVKEGQARAEDC